MLNDIPTATLIDATAPLKRNVVDKAQNFASVVIGILAPDISARLGISIRLIAYAVAGSGFFIAVMKADAAARASNGQ